MVASDTYLIPTRFLVTMGHTLAVLVAFFHLDRNIVASLSSDYSLAEQQSTEYNAKVAWTLLLLSFVFELVGILCAITIFCRKTNTIQIVLHYLGSLYTCLFIQESWHTSTLWYMLVFFNMIPCLLEISNLSLILWFKAVPLN